MGDHTAIEWTEASWNPLTGCDKVSDGCTQCYAESIAHRFDGTPAYPNGFAVTLRPERLDQPMRWRRPRRIFVNSMSDLFHDQVPDEYIAKVWAVMALSPRHTYQCLTKRHGRMRALLNSFDFYRLVYRELSADWLWEKPWFSQDVAVAAMDRFFPDNFADHGLPQPLSNVWLGVSAESQRWADIRIPALLDTPAAVRFISAEPLLGPIVLRDEWLEWTDGRHVESGERSLSSGGIGRTLDRPAGSSVAACCAACEPLDGRDGNDSVHAETRGESGREVPTGSSDVRRQSNPCSCSQAGLASLQRPDSARVDGESQEREALRQSPVESRTVDEPRAGQARATDPSPGELESVRPAQSDGEAVDYAGARDLLTQGGRGTAPGAGGRLRREPAGDIEDCSGRASLAWLIVGGESGPGARPMHPDWARGLRDQCQAAGVAFLHKQNGEWIEDVTIRPAEPEFGIDEPYRLLNIPPDHKNPKRCVMHLGGGTALTPDNPFNPFRAGHPGWTAMRRVGKKAAGRELDGRTWDQYPEAVTV